MILLLSLAATIFGSTSAQQVRVRYASANYQGPFTGQVVLYLTRTNEAEPRTTIEGPCYRLSVTRVAPGQPIVFTHRAIAYPTPLTKLERGAYFVQAVWDRNLGGRNIGTSLGNLYSRPCQMIFTADTNQVFELTCDQLIPAPGFTDSQFVQELRVSSKLLGAFHHQSQTVDGAVILPAQYHNEPKRHFPVLFVIGGYGADYHHYSKENNDTLPATPIDTIACIRVYLDGNCPLGHSVYANSDNNGPWADALVKEFIPALAKNYRCTGCYLLKGHSSGGWAGLWLQIHYPSVFAGCTASAPDYVDFHSINQRDYYQEVARVNQGKTVPPIVKHPHIEDVLYRGEQDRSFDAVYGPKGRNGQPISIQKGPSGVINPAVFSYWQRYDISRYLTTNVSRLKQALYGKVRVSVGNQDTYKLNFSVKKLEAALKSQNTGFVFGYYPGDHYSVMTPQYKKDETLFLAHKYHAWLNEHLPKK
jgi:hypothetical protein